MVMSDDVYKRYNIVNSEWILASEYDIDSVSLGLLLGDLYYNNGGSKYTIDRSRILSELRRYDNIKNYYYRNVITRKIFDNSSKVNVSNIGVYNRDPWNRLFPLYVTGDTSSYYLDMMVSGNVSRYGFSIFYDHSIIHSGNGVNNYIMLNNLIAPRAILHYTSLDGITIGCLDIIN